MDVTCFVWTDHAELRLAQRGFERADVEAAIRAGHAVRERNDGAADWRLGGGGFVVVYDHPVGWDYDTVRVVSLWRARRPRR